MDIFDWCTVTDRQHAIERCRDKSAFKDRFIDNYEALTVVNWVTGGVTVGETPRAWPSVMQF